MSFKTLLVHVEATAESDLRVRMAVTLAHEFDAMLVGVGGCEPAFIDNPMLCSVDGMVVQALADQEGVDLRDAEARFLSLAAELGEAACWMSAAEYPDRALEVYAAGADLIVTSAARGTKATTAAAADLVMRAGVPILSVPVDLPAIRTRTVVVAWKNRPQARRAVSDALPLLKNAEQVIVVEVRSAAEARTRWSGLEAVVGRLKRNGVRATDVEIPTRLKLDVADVVISFAEEQLADLIVAGAYGHSRAVEWVLGGVTGGLLERSTLPILFSR